jgi:hypothetical protein
VEFPAGYGYIVPAHTEWSANIHLLRTEGLEGGNPHKAAKECNECYYAPTKTSQCTKEANGTFDCCGEGDFKGEAHCPVSDAGKLLPAKNYHLRYTFSYTKDVSALIAVQIGTMSAPACSAFYNVLRDEEHPVNVASYELTLPFPADVVFGVGHAHTGALNVSLLVNGQPLCTSTPTYGSEEAGAARFKPGSTPRCPRSPQPKSP